MCVHIHIFVPKTNMTFTKRCSIRARNHCDDVYKTPAVFVRAMNILLVVRREEMKDVEFPTEGVVYRGGGLPQVHTNFYTEGKSFRVAGFLASSFSIEKAHSFMIFADNRQEPCVLWEIHVDPRGKTSLVHRCKHVSYVQRTNVPGEQEYLFAPYSPFTVKEVCATLQ